MIPFSPPKIYQELIDEVVDTLNSGWITTGPKTKRFEKMLTEYTGAKSTLCVNSATSGLELMLRWFGVGEGDEVIIPAYTYSATANVVIHCGAKPVFVDIGNDFNIDPAKIRVAISKKTKVIMPVDFAGFPCEYSELIKLVKDEAVQPLFEPTTEVQKQLGRILILADSAHAIGAKYQGRRLGSVSDIAVFSFHAVKNLSTAEGGAICLNLPHPFNNDELYASLCIKSLHGQNKDALAKTQKGNWKYDIVEAGYKYNMTDIQASLGLVELKNYDKDTLPRRKEIFSKYCQRLSKFHWAELPTFKTEDKESSYHLFPLRIREIVEEERDEIIRLIFDKDVSVNVHFLPVPMTSFYKGLGYSIDPFPTAYDSYAREISLPVYYDLSNDQVETVLNAVIESVQTVINK